MDFEKKKLIFSLILIITVLIACEFTLQVLTFVFPQIDILISREPRIAAMVYDEELGTRPNPKYPGHDQNGFRNKSLPKSATIVAMGDSQTYGTGVSINQAWPQQLGKLAEINTYNMAWGGYGPAHSLLLLKEAIDLNPKLVIETFYTGNDLFDSFNLVYNKNQLSYLKSNNDSLIKVINYVENIEPLAEKSERLFTMNENIKNNSIPKHVTVRDFVVNHSKLYGILRAIKRIMENGSSDFAWKFFKQRAIWNKQYCQIIENDNIKTVLTPNYHLCGVNLDDPRIAEGLRISLEAIQLMNKQALKANIEFVVLLIPTKEMVFKNVVYHDSTNIPTIYKTLIDNEELILQKTKRFLINQNIYFIDALPILKACVRNGIQPYKISWDGHLNAIGHQEVAKFVLFEIKKIIF